MTITFPRTDILTMVDYSADTKPLQLMSRQELSRTAGGQTIGKDFGPALWTAQFVTKPLPNDDASQFEAVLDSLDGVIQTFELADMRRLFPRIYPGGTGANDGVLLSVNANNKALALSGLVAGQVISVGDFLSFDYGGARALHRAVESVTANGSGVTGQFEVRPHIRPGWTLSPATAVKLKNPRGLFTLVSGSVTAQPNGSLHTVISFQAGQYLP
jgi:hypothetical protein